MWPSVSLVGEDIVYLDVLVSRCESSENIITVAKHAALSRGPSKDASCIGRKLELVWRRDCTRDSERVRGGSRGPGSARRRHDLGCSIWWHSGFSSDDDPLY